MMKKRIYLGIIFMLFIIFQCNYKEDHKSIKCNCFSNCKISFSWINKIFSDIMVYSNDLESSTSNQLSGFIEHTSDSDSDNESEVTNNETTKKVIPDITPPPSADESGLE